MAFITGTQYKQIADELADARDTQVLSKEFLFNAVYDVVLMQEIYPELDLLSPFWDTYNVDTQSVSNPINIIGAVRALQNHVLIRSTYATINSYLYNEVYPSLLQPSFQELSVDAGYAIDDMYVSI
jgi:hypothetical protein